MRLPLYVLVWVSGVALGVLLSPVLLSTTDPVAPSAAAAPRDPPASPQSTAAGIEADRSPSSPSSARALARRRTHVTGWVAGGSVGKPWATTTKGLLTFRGNPTRTYYGGGPVPGAPAVAWRYPQEGRLCGKSTVGDETREWCGTGWTGQPAVFVRDGRTWAVFGAYDYGIHFLDADTGEQILPPFRTGDIIKGSVTVDPDGHPLVFSGSRDGFYRVIAIDRDEPVELWRLTATDGGETMWNDDWDGAGLILDDYLFVGGENSRLHVVKLNRGYDADGFVSVDPALVFSAPGWDDELLRGIGDRNVSIESSVTVVGNTLYFVNSGGLVQGWDLTTLKLGGVPKRVFRFWMGDDADATVVADRDGNLYVAAEFERRTARSRQVGQIVKLDPSRPDEPLVWSVDDQATTPAGVWATPALHRDVLYVPTNSGRLLALDRSDGTLRWAKQLVGPTWSSPVVVDDVLVQGDCGGTLHAFDVSQTRTEPKELWALSLGGCIESTPALWDGTIVVGTRAGQVVGITDR